MEQNELIIYQSKDGKINLNIDLYNETVWLSLNQIAKLYGKDKSTISRHIKNIFESKELNESSVVAKNATTASDGKTYKVDFYNLDMIISIGYRVNSITATHFRQWATQTLKEYIIKGFVLNSERLKDPKGWDYFDELLERIREIRASEKRFYQKVRDLFALSSDYVDDISASNEFFAIAQNKLLYAVTGNTAPEIIINRGNSELPNMNLKTWKGSKVRKQDVITAKNYLQETEIKALDRFVVMFLDYAENQVLRRKDLRMSDWKDKIDKFIEFNEYSILTNAGSVSAEKAKQIAHQRYEEFDKKRKEQEAVEANEQDFKELEELETEIKKLPKNKEAYNG